MTATFMAHLPGRIAAIRANWHGIRDGQWDTDIVEHLFQRVSELGGLAGKLGLNQLTESLLELEVYLSSFVDAPLKPKQSQLTELENLINAIESVAGELIPHDKAPKPDEEVEAAADIPATDTENQTVYAVTKGARDSDRLVCGLRNEGLKVLEFDAIQSLIMSANETTPGAILISSDALSELDTPSALFERIRASKTQHIGLVVVSQSSDLETRLMANRAGADAFFVCPSDVDEVARKLKKLIISRDTRSYRVLIVDDDPAQAEFASAILHKAGVTTEKVSEPLTVLTALQSFKPDLVLMDIYMPEVNGIELTAIMRETGEYAALPIIFLSGEHDTDKQLAALSVGGDDFLAKPIAPNVLIAHVKNRIKRSRVAQSKNNLANTRDMSTGVFSRRYLVGKLDRLLSQKKHSETGYGLLYIEIDEPRKIRDKIGIGGTDTLVAMIAERLTTLSEPDDVVARFGEYSFVILSPNDRKMHSEKLATKIISKIRREVFEIDARSITATVSIGICNCEGLSGDALSMISRAERSCATAMDQGGCTALMYRPSVEGIRRANENEWLEDLIQESLRENNFKMLFQPVVGLKAQASEHYQVLLRLISNEKKINASEFIPVASTAGLLPKIDHWVLNASAELIARKHAESHDIHLFVSQDIETLSDKDYIDGIANLIELHHFPTAQLTLEFSAAGLSRSLKHNQAHINAIADLGVSIALTNFSNTPENMHLLQYVKVKYVKLSGECLENNKHDLTPFIEHLHELDMLAVAPRIEDPRVIASLWSSGTDFIQGNFIQRPDEHLSFDFSDSVLW